MTYTIPSGVRAALFDIDGTLTSGGEVWSVLIHSPLVSRARKSWLYGSGMPHYLLSKTGLVSQSGFRDRWVRLMAWLMKDWPEAQVQAMVTRLSQGALIPALRADVVDILRQHQAAGHPVLLVSTMFTGIVSDFAHHLGVAAPLGSVVGMANGRCLGRIEGPTCSGARKLDFARRYLEQHHPGIALADCAAYADSRSDIPFLGGAGYPVAVYPDDAMHAAARQQGWAVFGG